MELTEEVLTQLHAYLSGKLNGRERHAFEALIRQDDDLRRELILQHELKQGLALLAEKQRFKAIHTDLQQRGLLARPAPAPAARPAETIRPLPTHRTTFWSTWNQLTAAAAVVLLLGIGGLIIWRQSMPAAAVMQRERAFNSVFTPDLKAAPQPPADPDRLGASPAGETGSQDSVQLQQGVSLLQQQQLQPAIGQLRPVAQGLPGHWRASAQWFLALAYLKNGQPAQTDSLLTLISDANGHPYQLEARRLTNQLHHPPSPRP